MKARTIALLSVMASSMVAAQTAPPSQMVAPNAKPAAAKPMTQVKPAAPAVHVAKPAPAASPMQPKAKMAIHAPSQSPMQPKAVAVRVKPAAMPATVAVKRAAVKTASGVTVSKRDPFTSPIREQGSIGPTCSTGKKCLAINAMSLRGIVKSQAGMIAVVESSTRKISYFLRENDPVFNGYVVRITADTVVFRENVMDRLGKQSTRDVVMKVVAPAV
ncbi:MAG: hypothetical protein ACXVZJ_00525 [Terriglobales bacterium]